MRRILSKFINESIPNSGYEREYVVFMNRFVKLLQRVTLEVLIPTFRKSLAEQEELIKQDAWSDAVETAIAVIKAEMNNPLRAGIRLIVDLAQRVSGYSSRQWQRVAEARTGVNVVRSEPWLTPLLESWSVENAKLIKSIHDQYLERVAQRTHDMIRQGRSVREFREELAREYGLTSQRANIIARTEMAKLNGQITKARQKSLGIREYTWRTVGDERVRPTHEALHGKICQWDNPAVYRDVGSDVWKSRAAIGGFVGDPGQDYMCRCSAAARFEELLQRLGV